MIPKNKIVFDKEQHLYYGDDERTVIIPHYSAIISEVLGDPFSNVPENVRKEALEKGQEVHRLTEEYDRGNVDMFKELNPLTGYLDSWIKFKQDFGIENKTFQLIEEPLFSKVNWYACTLDRLIDDILIEIKTGQEYKTHRLQTAAQTINIEENLNIKVKQRLTVYLSESTYKVKPHDRQEDFDYWLAINKTFQWKYF